MKSTLRIGALIIGALILVALIPNSRSLQTPRDERIVIAVRDQSDALPPLPAAPTSTPIPPTLAPTPVHTPVLPTLAPVPAVREAENVTLEERLPTRASTALPRPYESLELYLHLPPDAAKRQPLRVLIVLHGFGARGDAFSKNLIEEADRNHWLLVAPTLPYRDFMDPSNLLKEDIRFSGLLVDMLDNLPRKLGMKLRQHALVYGFSRGAQLGHRLTLFYPERVESVVAISAGTYTLPMDRKSSDPTALMPMPYGVGDMVNYVGHPLDREELRKVSFLIQVGANDNDADEVPRQFDPYSGKNRVARAAAFQFALANAGVQSRLSIYPEAGHEITSAMRRAALQFLREEELAKKLND